MENETKPGYKTTEFWMAIAAFVVSALYGSGVIAEGTALDKALSVGAMILASMGYAVSRGLAKKS
jgi:hypothetical protein